MGVGGRELHFRIRENCLPGFLSSADNLKFAISLDLDDSVSKELFDKYNFEKENQ